MPFFIENTDEPEKETAQPSLFFEKFLKNFQPPPHFTLTFMPLSCKIFNVVKAYNFTEGGRFP